MASKQGRKEVPQQVGMVTSPYYKPPNAYIYDFYLHVPEDKKNVSCIALYLFRADTYQCIIDTAKPIYLEPVQAHENLWTAHVEIPTDLWMSKGSYYIYKISAKGSLLYLFPKYKYYTTRRQIHGTVHRDGTDQYLTFDGFLAHCLHVFDICNKSDIPVIRCIEQIEAMSSPTQVTLVQKHQLLEILQSKVTVFKRNSLILFTLMLNKIFRHSQSSEYCDHLQKGFIPFILETFKEENLCIYSKSCQNGLQIILLALCRHAYGTDYCLLDFINETYPFFDEGFFKEKIINCVSTKMTLCSANRKAEILTEILTVVGKRVHADSNDELDIKVSFLEKLFNHLPFSVALDGYCHFCKSLSLDEDKCTKLKERLLGALKANFESNISEHVHKGDFQRILEFWEFVKAEQKLAELLSSKLQLDLLHLCETPKGKSLSIDDCKSLQKLVLDTHLFKDEQSQTQLLKATVSSKVKNLHELFIHFVKQKKFCDYLSHDPNQLLKWIETARKHHIFVQVKHKKEVNICLCYEYLHDALAMPVVNNNGLLQEKLEKCIFECLAELDQDTVLGKYQDIERMQEYKPKIMELFIRHVRQLLHERYASYPPDEILKAISKTSDKLFINSSCYSMIVRLLMEQYCNCFGDNQFDNFISMKKMGKFWMLLLTMTGTETDSAKNHQVFKKGMDCLESIIESLKSKHITCSYFEKISKSREAIDLLIASGKVEEKEIYMILETFVKAIQSQKVKLTNIFTALHKIKEVIPCNNLPVGWKNLQDDVNGKEGMLKDGNISIGFVIDDTKFWSSCLKLPDICGRLVAYIDSKVFWNACLHTVPDIHVFKDPEEQSFEHNYEAETLCLKSDLDVEDKKEEDFGPLEVLTNIFSESGYGLDTYAYCVHFIENLEQLGSQKYREDWLMFCKAEDVPMTHVVKMFENADIQREVSLLIRNLQLSIGRKRENALYEYHEFNKYHEKVMVMKKTLDALEILMESDELFYEAITSFDKFMAHSLKEMSLEQVYEAINTIKTIAQIIGTSTELIKFLKEVANVDLRILIDAVEEVSEQSVNEATVLGLIEVKRLLQPFIKVDMDNNFQHLFLTISDHAKGTKPTELIGKIIDCRENLHNLRSLYSNVANIGLKTKEIIDNVIKIGKFCFKVDTRDTSIMTIEYSLDDKDIIHEQETLIDLRSRVLLLMNTDTKSKTEETVKKKENLMKFLIYVDTALEIDQLLTNLFMSGHFLFKRYETKMEASGLESFKDKLRDDYTTWCKRLEECQREHYWMNFILGNQLHIIHDYLETREEKDSVESEKENERVLSILQFIHPEIKIAGMQNYYSNIAAEPSLLNKIALTLEHAMKDLQPLNRLIDKSFTFSSRVTDCVRPGKLSVVALEEKSKLVIQIMLALYKNTVHKLPEPHQVHFCNQDTTWVELQLLLHRCIRSDK